MGNDQVKSVKNKKKEVVKKDQVKFFVDLSTHEKERVRIVNLLEEVNKKDYGGEVNFKELTLYALNKLGEKDIDKVKESSLTEMEKVQRTLDEYNKKNTSKLTLGEYLVKKLNIS